jgi:hypothetical protein
LDIITPRLFNPLAQAQPEEIAPAFVFLAAPSCSSCITGEILPIAAAEIALRRHKFKIGRCLNRFSHTSMSWDTGA